MRKNKLIFSLEDDNDVAIEDEGSENPDVENKDPETDPSPVENEDGTPDNPDEDTESTGDTNTDIDLSVNNDDADKPEPVGPLNVELVYYKQQLENENKVGSNQYEKIVQILNKRKDNIEPIATDIEVAKDLKEDPKDNSYDLLDDETSSSPDDLDDEQYVKIEYEDMALENYATEVRYTNNYSDHMKENIGADLKTAASVVGKAAIKGFNYAAPIVIDRARKANHALINFINKHKDNISGLESKLIKLEKEVVLKKEFSVTGYYTNQKVLSYLFSHDNENIKKTFAEQLNLYKKITKFTVQALTDQEQHYKSLLSLVSNPSFNGFVLKNLIIPDHILEIMKKSNKESNFSSLVEMYESKQVLFNNKVLLATLPKSGIDTVEDYIQAMNESQMRLYQFPDHALKAKYLNQRELLDSINMALIMLKELKTNEQTTRRMTSLFKNITSTASSFNLFTQTNKYALLDKEQREHLNNYLTASQKYILEVYITPYININNNFFNGMKYFVYFVKDHLK